MTEAAPTPEIPDRPSAPQTVDLLAEPPTPFAPVDDVSELKNLAVPLGILFVIAFYLFVTQEPQAPLPEAEVEPRLRVALIERTPEQVVVDLPGPWFVDAEPDGPSRLVESPGRVVVETDGEGFTLSGGVEAKLPGMTDVVFRPAGVPIGEPESIFGLGERHYRGRLRLKRLPDGALRAINSVGIEDYLTGVVGHEMPLSWSDEALKAQVIAARTYALQERKPGRDHDLKSDTRSQVYGGLMKRDQRARALVEATRAQIVVYHGEPVTTYFHSTCGGDTVPAKWVFPWVTKDIPALSGATHCTCQASKFYRWTKRIDLADQRGLKVGLPLRAATVDHWPRGHYARSVTLVGADGRRQQVSGWNARRLFGLRAYAFDLKLEDGGKTLRVDGRGWGHGVGLCQYGAEGFSKRGLDAKAILAHFYPGTTVANLGY